MVKNNMYWDNLTREYGNVESIDNKAQRFKTDFKFEELTIGMKVLNFKTNTQSTILDLISGMDNIIVTKDFANKKKVDESRKKKGINCTNRYLMEAFCRQFKRVK